MWKDPVVKETRDLRIKYAAEFKNDPDAIFKDILRRQEISKRKHISFPAHKPKSGKIMPKYGDKQTPNMGSWGTSICN